MKNPNDLTPEEKEIEERMKQPLDEEDWNLLSQMEQDAQGLLDYKLKEIENSETEKEIFSKEILFHEIFGKWKNSIHKPLTGIVGKGIILRAEDGIKTENETTIQIQFQAEEKTISFMPTSSIAKARLWCNEELFFYRADWKRGEKESIPLEFIVKNPEDCESKWLFKEGLNWDIVETDEQGKIEQRKKKSWYRPKPLKEKREVVWAREKFESPELDEIFKDVIPKITTFENRIENINGKYFQLNSLMGLLWDYKSIVKDLSAGVSDPRALKIISGYFAAQLKALFASFWTIINLIISFLIFVGFIFGLGADFSRCAKSPNNQPGQPSQPPSSGKGAIYVTPTPPKPNKPALGTPKPTSAEVMKTGEFKLVFEGQFNFIGESKGRIIIVNNEFNLLYSDDGFQNAPSMLEHPEISYSPKIYIDDLGNIYLISRNSIYKSIDRGNKWERIFTYSQCNIYNIFVTDLSGYDAIATIPANCVNDPSPQLERNFMMISFKSGNTRVIPCKQEIYNKMLRIGDEVYTATEGNGGIFKISSYSATCSPDNVGLPILLFPGGSQTIMGTYSLVKFKGAIVAGGKKINYKLIEGQFQSLLDLPEGSLCLEIVTDSTGNYMAAGLDHTLVYVFKSLREKPYLVLNIPEITQKSDIRGLLFTNEFIYAATGTGIYRGRYK